MSKVCQNILLAKFIIKYLSPYDWLKEIIRLSHDLETMGYAMTHFSGESPNITSGFPRKSHNERSTS